MKLKFTKMHGCGNDYVYFSTFDQAVPHPEELAVRLSDRRKGIGGDGVILIHPSKVADARMQMFNLDGSEGKMCGNGIRCVGKYIYDHGIAKKPVVTVETLSGIKTLELTVENGKATAARVDMGAPILTPEKIPTTLCAGQAQAVDVPLAAAGKEWRVTCVSMGNPHCVIFVQEDPMALDLEKIGPEFEHHPAFPEDVNTEFVQVLDATHLNMRVWERGSGETMACGTGATATAVAAVLNGISPKNEDITVHLRGGDLIIRVTGETAYMTGEAVEVFEGTVEV